MREQLFLFSLGVTLCGASISVSHRALCAFQRATEAHATARTAKITTIKILGLAQQPQHYKGQTAMEAHQGRSLCKDEWFHL